MNSSVSAMDALNRDTMSGATDEYSAIVHEGLNSQERAALEHAVAGRRGLRVLLCVGVLSLLERRAPQKELRLRFGRTANLRQLGFRLRIVARVERRGPGSERTARRSRLRVDEGRREENGEETEESRDRSTHATQTKVAETAWSACSLVRS